MRHVTLSVLFAVATTTVGGAAYATPFEPATIPDQVQAVGHLDVDALRKTQIFNAVGGSVARSQCARCVVLARRRSRCAVPRDPRRAHPEPDAAPAAGQQAGAIGRRLADLRGRS